MTELKEFKLPDVGEGLTEAEIVRLARQPRRQVDGQPDDRRDRDRQGGRRAAVARTRDGGPAAGRGGPDRRRRHADHRGRRTGSPRPATPPVPPDRCRTARGSGAATSPDRGQPERQPVLVGYGVKAAATTRRAAQDRGHRGRRPHPAAARRPGAGQAAGAQAGQGPRHQPGADWPGAGRSGSVTREDVQRAAGSAMTRSASEIGRTGHRQPARPRGRPGRRRADPGPGGAQAHGRGHGGQRVHRAARDRVPAGRRHRDDGRGAPRPRPA